MTHTIISMIAIPFLVVLLIYLIAKARAQAGQMTDIVEQLRDADGGVACWLAETLDGTVYHGHDRSVYFGNASTSRTMNTKTVP